MIRERELKRAVLSPLGSHEVALAIDGGTTFCRVWATRRAGEVITEARTQIGAREGAAAPDAERTLQVALRRLLGEVAEKCGELGLRPRVIVAGGMITSPTGLVHVPHIEGPVGLAELAAGALTMALPEVSALPFVFVPGVRFSGAADSSGGVAHADLVRGEELLCLGLVAAGELAKGGSVISLGSHWKRLDVDCDGRLCRSVSTLSGELVAAVSGHTLLAASLPALWDQPLDVPYVLLGAQAAAERGLSRALYEVRLLHLTTTSTTEQRLAYLWGAALGADCNILFGAGTTPLLVGRPNLCAAATAVANSRGIQVRTLTPERASHAFRRSCLDVLQGPHNLGQTAQPPA